MPSSVPDSPGPGIALSTLASFHDTRQISDGKRYTGSHHDPPGPWNVRPAPQIQLHTEAAQHPHHRPDLVSSPGEHAQKEHSEQSAIGHGRNLQPHFHYASHLAQSDERQ